MSRFNAASRFVVPLLVINAILMTALLFGEQARDAMLGAGVDRLTNSSPPPPPPLQHANATKDLVIEIDDPPKKPHRPTCSYCTSQDLRCAEYGKHNLERSRAYEGPAARLKKVIKKAQRGEPIKLAILGGSVSFGHGVSHYDNWVLQIFQWWNTTFPHPDNVFINGAVPAITSDYFATCALEHIDEDVDIVLVELAVNDGDHHFFSQTFEWLMRLLLVMPKQPAVINVQAMALAFDIIRTGGDIHLNVAQYYDVPTVSIRNMMQQTLLKNPALEMEFWSHLDDTKPDLRHIGVRGHKMLADLTISLIERQICLANEQTFHPWEMTEDGPESDLPASTLPPALIPTYDSLFEIPSMTLWDDYKKHQVVPDVHPKCFSTRSKKSPLVPLENDGWTYMTWNDKTYLGAGTPGASVSFEVELGELGLVKLHYLRSSTLGLGDLKCWLDDRPNDPQVFHGYWTDSRGNVVQENPVIVGGSPGKHVVLCQLLNATQDPKGGTDFRIVSITSL